VKEMINGSIYVYTTGNMVQETPGDELFAYKTKLKAQFNL